MTHSHPAETWQGRPRLNYFEDFPLGKSFSHHWGKTFTASESIEFATSSLTHEPYLFNRDYAKSLGHPDLVIAPMLVYTTTLGLSVHELSEAGGPFLGSTTLRYGVPAYPGDTVVAASTVVSSRVSKNQAGFGIVTWHTEGTNQDGDQLVSFNRTNLVPFREHA